MNTQGSCANHSGWSNRSEAAEISQMIARGDEVPYQARTLTVATGFDIAPLLQGYLASMSHKMTGKDQDAYCSSAASRVWAVTELAEMVLGKLEILELVRMQRTCRRFYSLIESSKTSRRRLTWIPALGNGTTNHFEDYDEFQRFLTFVNIRDAQPIYSFRMWQSTSNEAITPIRLRFHETMKVVPEYDTTILDLQGASKHDLRRWIILDESERAVEIMLKRANSIEMVKTLQGGATIGDLYDVLCDMSMQGQRSDFAQAFIN